MTYPQHETMETRNAVPRVDAPFARQRPIGALPRSRHRAVAFHRCDPEANPDAHDISTKAHVARSIARLLELDFEETDGDVQRLAARSLYVVPSDTLQDMGDATRLGIRNSGDLFGGLVPHPFAATKVITHTLVSADATAPKGWSHAMGAAVRDVVLPGFSVFTRRDAKVAGERLLERGAVRIKEAGGVGGVGQSIAGSGHELDEQLGAMDEDVLLRHGLVLEQNLASQVTTYSVGQVQIGPWLATYSGTQCLTRNHHGAEVYGGSDLTVVRGDFAELLNLALPEEVRLAVSQALAYHQHALEAFPAMLVSRCNYDVVRGLDDAGVWRSGVLEQSWRIGGASGAEVAALSAFQADPNLQVVRASTHEWYGEGAKVPPGGLVHFDGVDSHVGRLTKYACVDSHVNI